MFLVELKDCFCRGKKIKLVLKYEEEGKYGVQIFFGDTLSVKNTFETVESRDSFYDELRDRMLQVVE